ncbi:MAG: hypothetical protein Q9168_007545 [Polycauliona sp. 1 TL-2023]
MASHTSEGEVPLFAKTILQQLDLLEAAPEKPQEMHLTWSKVLDLSDYVETYFHTLGKSINRVSNLRSSGNSGGTPSSTTDWEGQFQRNVENLVGKAWNWHEQISDVDELVCHYYFGRELDLGWRDVVRIGTAWKRQMLLGEALKGAREGGADDVNDDAGGTEGTK